MEAVLGATLLHNGKNLPISEVSAPYIGLYFASSWSAPCQAFTTLLKDFYARVNSGSAMRLEVVFISSDKDTRSFEAFAEGMPWRAVPHGDNRVRVLTSRYKSEAASIPCLVLINAADGRVVCRDARPRVLEDPAGAAFPWAARCFYEVLPPELELLGPGGALTTLAAVRESASFIGVYFAAAWCVPCAAFTAALGALHDRLRGGGGGGRGGGGSARLAVLVLSWDRTPAAFEAHARALLAEPRRGGWYVVPWAAAVGARDELAALLGARGLPSLPLLRAADGAAAVEDARSRLLGDPAGFPWPPRAVEPLCVAAEGLNDAPWMVLFTDGLRDAEAAGAAGAGFADAAEGEARAAAAGKPGAGVLRFALAAAGDACAPRVREFFGIDVDGGVGGGGGGGGIGIGIGDFGGGGGGFGVGASAPRARARARLVVLNVQAGVKYVWPGSGTPAAADVRDFIAAFKAGRAGSVGLRAPIT